MHDDKEDVLERCRQICIDHILPIDTEKVTPTAAFIEDLGADSLDMVELVMSAEEEFGVQISDDEAEKMVTVRDAADAIFAKLR